MHGPTPAVLGLLLLVAGSFVVPTLARWTRVPSAVLLIAFGILVGPSVLGWMPESAIVDFLYELGFMVLMFLAGLEIDFNAIRRRGARPLVGMFLVCVAIFALAFGVAALLGLHPIYGLALGATSVGLPLAVLLETRQSRTTLGQNIILLASIGEFLTIVGMTLFYFASEYGLSVELAWGVGKLLGVLLAAGVTLRLLVAAAWWHPERFATFFAEKQSSEIGVRGALLLMLAFSVLAMAAGVEMVVGSFIAGALIAFALRGKHVLEEKLAALGHGLFVPLFFVIVGLRFDAAVVSGDDLLRAAELVVAAFAVRMLPSVFLVRGGFTLRETFAAANLLAAPLTLIVAIAAIGVEVGALDAAGRATLIVLALASGALFPTVFRLVARRA